MPVTIDFIRPDWIRSWRETVEEVAAERIYLARITMPPFDPDNAFPHPFIANNWPMYCALDAGRVVGWADITPSDIPECAHRGTLGMGLLKPYRGQGLGGKLLQAALDHAPVSGLEKIELSVLRHNTAAIALYRKFGFTEAGTMRDWRRVDGVSHDSLLMERFLN